MFRSIFTQGPVYTSNNYGTLIFREDRRFNWTGYMLLVPQVIPASALGSGTVDMRLYLSNALSERYAGAFTLYFDGVGGSGLSADFMYSLDSQGLRIEHVPQTSLDGITVARRASSPLVIYFFRSESQDDRSGYSAPLAAPGASYGQNFSDDDFYDEDDPYEDDFPDLFEDDLDEFLPDTWD